MTPTVCAGPLPGNPFATRWTRPGASPYLFTEGQSVELLLQRLHENAWRGQIVGPHGVGKSTLLTTLQRSLQQAGHLPHLVTLRNGGQGAEELWRTLRTAGTSGTLQLAKHRPATIVMLDGAEQLSWVARRWLCWRCQARGWGLIVTSHRNLGLPLLARIEPRLDVAMRVVESLLSARTSSISSADIVAAFQRQRGDLREMLFALYELHEDRVRRLTPQAACHS